MTRFMRHKQHSPRGHNRFGILWVEHDLEGRARCAECWGRLSKSLDCRKSLRCRCNLCSVNRRIKEQERQEAQELRRERWKRLGIAVGTVLLFAAIGTMGYSACKVLLYLLRGGAQ